MGARAWCPCGWRGPVRVLLSQADQDAGEHADGCPAALEPAEGDR